MEVLNIDDFFEYSGIEGFEETHNSYFRFINHGVLKKNTGEKFNLRELNLEREGMKWESLLSLSFEDPEFLKFLEVNNEHIIRCEFFSFSASRRSIYFGIEHFENGSVLDFLTKREIQFSEIEIAAITKSILLALCKIHERKICVKEIRADLIKINDIGFAKFDLVMNFVENVFLDYEVGDLMKKRSGPLPDPFWLSPESILNLMSNNDLPQDIWSLGIAIIEIAEGSAPLSITYPMKAFFLIPKLDPPTLKKNDDDVRMNWSVDMNNFLARCLKKNPKERPSAKELLSDQWITNFFGDNDDDDQKHIRVLRKMMLEYFHPEKVKMIRDEMKERISYMMMILPSISPSLTSLFVKLRILHPNNSTHLELTIYRSIFS